MIFENQGQLDERLRYWQGVLRLRDWDVRATICRAKDMNDGAVGSVRVHLTLKAATIQILDQIDDPEKPPWNLNHEATLIHELLHIYDHQMLASLDEDAVKALEIPREQMAECLAQAFVGMEEQIQAWTASHQRQRLELMEQQMQAAGLTDACRRGRGTAEQENQILQELGSHPGGDVSWSPGDNCRTGLTVQQQCEIDPRGTGFRE